MEIWLFYKLFASPSLVINNRTYVLNKGDEDLYCVYMHKNTVNGKMYIGVTNDTDRRWRRGGTEYKSSVKFYGAIQKYGFDAFEHLILEENLEKEEAFKKEVEYISLYDTCNRKKGYNFSPGGNGGRVYRVHPRNMLGKSQTDYQKAHQRDFMKEENNNPMKNGKVVWGKTHPHPKGFSGKHKSLDERARISTTLKNNKYLCKPIRVIFPNGEIREFDSTKEAEKIGLTKPVILKLLRSGQPFEIKVINQYSKKNEHLVGIRFEYQIKDDTEVISESKESLAP